MRLDFNVLWVDDQPARVEAQIKKIRSLMEEEGFNFRPTICKSMDQVKAAIAEDIFRDEVDLILVDWDLGSDIRGQDVIEEIRRTIPYKDVIFYSAQTSPGELRQSALGKNLEGLYCTIRDDLVIEVEGVFGSLVKKVLDLDHTRGIVMGATCDIDQMVRECIEAMHELSDSTGKEKLLTGMSEFVTEEIKKLKAIAEKLEDATNIEPFFSAHLLFTSYHRLRILSRLLKESRFSAYSEYRTTVVKYLDQKEGVVRGRNLLGHVVLIPEGSPKAISVGKGQTISVEKARELRKKILEARTKFRQLREGLQSATSKVSAAAASHSIPVRSE